MRIYVNNEIHLYRLGTEIVGFFVDSLARIYVNYEIHPYRLGTEIVGFFVDSMARIYVNYGILDAHRPDGLRPGVSQDNPRIGYTTLIEVHCIEIKPQEEEN